MLPQRLQPPPHVRRILLEPPPPPPASIGPEIIEEFKNLAVVCAQLSERLALVEQDVKRLNRDNQELRELLTRHNGM